MPDYRLPEAPPDEYAPVLDFDTFLTYVFRWLQDQHVAVIGPTEQGKSNLAFHLLALRDYVAYLGIKSDDATLDAFGTKGGYVRSYDWPTTVGRVRKRPATWQEVPRRLVWPDAHDRRRARVEQARVFGKCLDECWASGSVAVVWDDFWYIVHILKMEMDAKQNLLNARSAHSPQMIIAQRGAGNRMVELFDQPTHLFFARETDQANLQRLGPANSIRRGMVANLDRYQFYYENTRTDQRYRVTAPLLAA